MRVRSMDAFIAPPYQRERRGNEKNGVAYEEHMPQQKTDLQRKYGLPSDVKTMVSKFGKDDYILIGLIAVLIFEGCDDYVLLAALGYLFVMGII